MEQSNRTPNSWTQVFPPGCEGFVVHAICVFKYDIVPLAFLNGLSSVLRRDATAADSPGCLLRPGPSTVVETKNLFVRGIRKILSIFKPLSRFSFGRNPIPSCSPMFESDGCSRVTFPGFKTQFSSRLFCFGEFRALSNFRTDLTESDSFI